MVKKIFICFDGTGNGPIFDTDNCITNVLKLHILAGGNVEYENDNYQCLKDDGQITLYQIGIGAKEKKDVDGKLDSIDKVMNKIEFALGDLNSQIDPMMGRLAAVYEPGDKLYITGFSRGAASARQFNADLCYKGLDLPSGNVKPEVELLGVWDTVAAEVKDDMKGVLAEWKGKKFPLAANLNETGGNVPPNVKKAVHLVSLDDCRMWEFMPFPQTLMGSDERLTEVYFPGSHCDVGGGWYEKGLSDGALEYMKKHFEAAGLKFLNWDEVEDAAMKLEITRTKEITLPKDFLKIASDPKEKLHWDDQRKEKPSSRPVCTAKNDEWVLEGGNALLHESVLAHMKARENDNGSGYSINPNLYKMGFTVVGESGDDLCVELPEKTEELKKFLAEAKASPTNAIAPE